VRPSAAIGSAEKVVVTSGLLPLNVAIEKLLRWRWAVAIVLTVFIALIAWFLLTVPVVVAFVGVVVGAIAWCIWLERHPEPPAR
jgi:hypothetical protein